MLTAAKVEEQLESLKGISTPEHLMKACILCNSLQYVTLALKHWGEQFFFLVLHHEKERRKVGQESLQLLEVEGTIFDDVIKLNNLLGARIVSTIVESIVKSFSYSSLGYFRQRTRTQALHMASGELSPDIGYTIEGLRGTTGIVAEFLCPALVEPLATRLAGGLDDCMVDQLLNLSKRREAVYFNHLGSEQLSFDLSALFDLFNAQSATSVLPVSGGAPAFHRTEDACRTLAMPVREVREFVEELQYQTLAKQKAILMQYRILSLTPGEVKDLLALRSDIRAVMGYDQGDDDDLL